MKRGAETREEISRRFVVRSFWIFGVFVFFSFFLVVRATYLQVLNKDFLIEQGNLRQIRDINIAAYRGTINDRNNKPLAISIPVDTISINPKKFNEDDIKMKQLSVLLGRDHEELIKLIKNSKFVGEETYSKDPLILKYYQSDNYCWTVDPIDGTSNFAKSKDRFAVMVSLTKNKAVSYTHLTLPTKA